MSTKRLNHRSFSMGEDIQNKLDEISRANNVPVSKIVRDLIETHLLQGEKKITVVMHEPEFVPVVLKVPSNLLGKKHDIKSWLNLRVTGIVERLSRMSPPEPKSVD